MIIDKIETKRNKTTVYAGENAYPFALEILEKYGLKEGEADGKLFFEAKRESDRLLCRRALYAMIDRSEKSKRGYVDALTDKGYAFPVATEVVEEAEKKGLVSDRRYAECYIHLHGGRKGWYRIAAELKAKGVPEEIVGEFREDFGDHTKECEKAAEKYLKGLEDTYENRQKVYAKLLRRGFTSDEIVTALGDFGKNGSDGE